MVSVDQAFNHVKQNKYFRWSNSKSRVVEDSVVERLKQGLLSIEGSPKFKFDRQDTFFTIGSCFAREIETFLVKGGFDVCSRFDMSEKFIKRDGVSSIYDFFNRYNLGSMFHEFESLSAKNEMVESKDLYYSGLTNDFDDLHYTPAVVSGSLLECMERRKYIHEKLSAALRNSTVVIITLGLVEAWYDVESGYYLNVVSSPNMLKKNKERLDFRFVGYNENIVFMEKIVDLLKNKKIIVTVSPVPLDATFTNKDIIVANMEAKSILRAVAADVCNKYDNVDYFPSYEIAMLSDRYNVWKEDARHIQPKCVEHIVKTAIDYYME